ncbi:unnamed protein product [Candidula unifasciata]|uniref:Regulator of microtubule dynamics protein 1 n=1 Tax=Candidula unifasciata TaxID=100452 RepID=A0A8S3Z4X9_9EUPU|nr:unnamed protein product [Candidula unifasciata]
MVLTTKTLVRMFIFCFRVSRPFSQTTKLQLSVFVRFAANFKKKPILRHNFWKVPLSLIIPAMAASSPETQKLLDEADALFDKKDFLATYDLLIPHKDSKDANILWRLARAAADKGKMFDGDVKKKLIYEAFEYIKKALELDDNNSSCHKWYGILLDYTGEYEGTKQKIANAFTVRDHFQKAIELNPKDATSKHCMGVWCFTCADLPWIQRKMAAVVFSTPPTSTYEEALEYFKSAEEASPGFYNQNLVMLGKTYLRLKDKDSAKKHLLKALEHEDKTTDDAKARKEAIELLKELGVKV